jgi:hypothetical protein
MSRYACSAPPGLAPRDHMLWCPVHPLSGPRSTERTFSDEDIEEIYREHRQHLDAAPVDVPARFRAAAEVAAQHGLLREWLTKIAYRMSVEDDDLVEAIWQTLTREQP